MVYRVVVQWDREALEDAEAESRVDERSPEGCFDDPVVYDLICSADTVGVFQVESRAKAQVLPRLQPRYFASPVERNRSTQPGTMQKGNRTADR
ncbi:MAG: hypothetical protein J0M33_09720 [Anaerolineae bacterium]|nr:hypothetical protein [Anaerolineae bacterium]